MTDILIRDVPDDVLRRIDADAARAGLSRNEYLRREVERLARRSANPVTVADFRRFTDLTGDLTDDAVMRRAWS
ncbi:antitoxin [Skermania sp. ID1734]|uniref:type II toxin-antitoxin system VapB family antitoxin n=1 Tax=Skermania sp. ID1734 TaxID=2597516 RepID=UPI00117E9B0F|nr:antitoxin [Skermania sp. ID1734]TSD94100.1 antitoxin [Skermania sp. ID1734]